MVDNAIGVDMLKLPWLRRQECRQVSAYKSCRADDRKKTKARAPQTLPREVEARDAMPPRLPASDDIRKDFAGAADSFRAALKLKPGNTAVAINLGNVLRELGSFDEATACYRQALAGGGPQQA